MYHYDDAYDGYGDMGEDLGEALRAHIGARSPAARQAAVAREATRAFRPGRVATPREGLRDRLVRERDALEVAITHLAGKLARRVGQVEHMARYPVEDPFEDGATLRFEKRFPDGEKSYSYAAQRADGLYYLTGARAPQGLTWERLVDFMGLGVDEVYEVGRGRNGRRKVIG